MAIGPFIPGESSRSSNLSPPLPGERSNLNPAFRRTNEEMNGIFVGEEIRVREELGQRSHHNLSPQRPPPDQTNRAQFCLVFLNEVGDRIYAKDLVKDENKDPIKVALYDRCTQSIISPNCSLSSAKLILMVLDAEFWVNKGETWSWSEFNQSVLIGRNGKPILTCPSLPIPLENGVGTFKQISFNYNSNWLNSKSIRLGVKVDGEEGYLNGERVQECISKSFRVMDRKSKASEKPKQLKLTHDVKCIKKVGNYRASLLKSKNISTVEDFLKLYYNDESAICEILCIKSESDRGWMSMVEHATQCADEYHTKCNASNNSSHPQQVSVHPMERNMPLSTNGGRLVVGLGPSAPNLSENNRIEGDMLAINRQHDPSNVFSCLNDFLLSEPFPSDGDGSSQIDPLGYFAFDERLSLSKTTG
ncbi:calmodulin-binding protein 60 B-like isoform X1 [Carex rostrata]